MSSKSSNSENLGFSYNFPNAGFMSKVRTSLGQFGDVFSEFNKFMSPQYDRCERSVAMRIYSMNKREILIVFLSFFACFGLGILIGLAGKILLIKINLNIIIINLFRTTNFKFGKTRCIDNASQSDFK